MTFSEAVLGAPPSEAERLFSHACDHLGPKGGSAEDAAGGRLACAVLLDARFTDAAVRVAVSLLLPDQDGEALRHALWAAALVIARLEDEGRDVEAAGLLELAAKQLRAADLPPSGPEPGFRVTAPGSGSAGVPGSGRGNGTGPGPSSDAGSREGRARRTEASAASAFGQEENPLALFAYLTVPPSGPAPVSRAGPLPTGPGPLRAFCGRAVHEVAKAGFRQMVANGRIADARQALTVTLRSSAVWRDLRWRIEGPSRLCSGMARHSSAAEAAGTLLFLGPCAATARERLEVAGAWGRTAVELAREGDSYGAVRAARECGFFASTGGPQDARTAFVAAATAALAISRDGAPEVGTALFSLACSWSARPGWGEEGARFAEKMLVSLHRTLNRARRTDLEAGLIAALPLRGMVRGAWIAAGHAARIARSLERDGNPGQAAAALLNASRHDLPPRAAFALFLEASSLSLGCLTRNFPLEAAADAFLASDRAASLAAGLMPGSGGRGASRAPSSGIWPGPASGSGPVSGKGAS
ncbi:MAG: hypothetical protein LBQ79_01185, partial [Deltaproteobacteria bacterium]|nr:hypothetical protein [Deltaproteobacteria bacterium]